MLLESGFILLVIFLVLLVTVFRVRALEKERRASLLKEAFWKRRNKLPILIETVRQAGPSFVQDEKVILELKEKLSSVASPIKDQMALEEELSERIQDYFKRTREVSALREDALYHALHKEFAECYLEICRLVRCFSAVPLGRGGKE